jgi:hypothetical protein
MGFSIFTVLFILGGFILAWGLWRKCCSRDQNIGRTLREATSRRQPRRPSKERLNEMMAMVHMAEQHRLGGQRMRSNSPSRFLEMEADATMPQAQALSLRIPRQQTPQQQQAPQAAGEDPPTTRMPQGL